MPLLDDAGQPLFGGPPPADAPMVNPALAPAPEPAPADLTAAAPQAAESVPEADASGALTAPVAVTPEPEIAAAPPPSPAPDWDAPDNPWRQEAERQRAEAQRAQQTAAQMQAGALAQAEQQSRQRQTMLVQQRADLDRRVGDLAPEEFQRHANALTQQMAAEFQRSNAEKQAIFEHFGRANQEITWHTAVAQATADYGLTPDERAYANQHAQNTDHLAEMAGEMKRRRDRESATTSQIAALTTQLAQLRSDSQQRRSEAAATRQANGADRAGGVGGSPVPTPPPTSALGLLRQAFHGDPNAPIRP